MWREITEEEKKNINYLRWRKLYWWFVKEIKKIYIIKNCAEKCTMITIKKKIDLNKTLIIFYLKTFQAFLLTAGWKRDWLKKYDTDFDLHLIILFNTFWEDTGILLS